MMELSAAKALRYRWLLFSLLALGYILVYFHRICPAVLAVDLMRDLQAGGSLAGMLGAAYFYPYAAMQLPAGLLADSWGPRRTISVFFLLAAAGAVLLGIAPTIRWAIAGRALVGAGVAMLFVSTLKILVEWFRPTEFARMAGVLLAMGGVGSLTAATPLVWLSAAVGWRLSFVLVGGATLLLAAAVALLVRNRPADLGWPSIAPAPGGDGAAIPLRRGVVRVLSCPGFWPLAAWFFFNFGIFFSFGGLWAGPYLAQVYGWSRAEAGRILSMLAVGLLVGGPALSWISDRVLRRRKPVLVLCSGAVLAMTALLAFHTEGLPPWLLYGLFTLLAACGNAVGAIGFTMNKELFPSALAGTATGLVNLFCFAGGAVFQHLLGHVLEGFAVADGVFAPAGYRAAFQLLFVSGIAAFGSALLSRETLTPPAQT